MKSTRSEMIPIGFALKESLKNGYNLQKFKCDAIAALTGSLVALPYSMAIAIAVGLPPQNGLYTAIAAGITVPLLGGSIMQVSGPTSALIAILAPIAAQYGPRGLMLTSLLAGFLLVFLGIAKLGRYINYVPYPVIIGCTAGIAVTIGTIALNDFLGLDIKSFHGEYIQKVALIVEHLPTLNWAEALVGIVTLVSIIVLRRIFPKVPPHIFAIGVGTWLAFALQKYGFTVATLGSRFSYPLPDGGTGHGVPPFPPTLHIPGLDSSSLFAWPTLQEIFPLMLPALIVTALITLESLLSATTADGMAKTKHHPNSELIGIGIGNILSGLIGGFPACGSFSRTTANIKNGARTSIASFLHGVILLIYMVSFAPFLSYIPMASLAAILVNIAYHVSHYRQFNHIIKIGPKSESIVLLICFALTVLINMVAGVTAGVVLACFFLS